jgi:hypothetical protein
MAFCTNCGKPLADGEICNCQEQQMNQEMSGEYQEAQPNLNVNPEYQEAQPSQNINPVYQETQENKPQTENLLNESFGQLFLILKKPSDAAEAFVVAADVKQAIVLILLQAILTGIFSLCIVSKINDLVGSDVFSTGGTFRWAVGMSVVFSIVFMALSWTAAAISKGKTTYQQMLSAAAVRSVYVMPITVISVALFFVKFYYGIGFFILAGLFISCAAMLKTLSIVPEINENLKIYWSVAAMFIFSIVVVYFTLGALPNVFSSDFKDWLGEIDKVTDIFSAVYKIIGWIS